MGQEDEAVPDRKRRLISEGVLLALTPVIAYMFAYLYERGHATRFGYPHWLIDVDLYLVLSFWLGMFAFLMFLFVAAAAATPMVPVKAVSTVVGLLLVPTLLVPLIAIIVPRFPGWLKLPYLLICGLGVVVWIWLRIIDPLLPGKYSGSPIEKWQKHANDISQDGPFLHVVPGSLADLIGPERAGMLTVGIVWGVLLIAVLGGGIYGFGWANAGASHRFLVREIERGDEVIEVVALRRFGDRIVAGQLDRDEGLILRRYFLFSLADAGNWSWNEQRFGHLNVEPTPCVSPCVSTK